MRASSAPGISTVVSLALVLAAATACSAPRPGATTRLARHFGIADVSSERSIEAGLAAKLPPGTAEASVVGFLTSSGLGKDGLSSIHPADADRVIVARIEFDPESFGLVKESYGILFRLDEQRALESIEVKKWLTGL